MRSTLGLLLFVPLLLATTAVGPCDSQGAGGDSGSAGALGATVAVACSDGTMKTDCCPDSVLSGSACNVADLSECWTRCAGGYRGHYLCTARGWQAAKGLYTCVGETSRDAHPSDSGMASSADAFNEAGGPAGAVTCNDGTGAIDCCPAEVSASSTCGPDVSECWTHCQSGYRGHFFCSAGVWMAAKGLYPCSPGDGGGSQ